MFIVDKCDPTQRYHIPTAVACRQFANYADILSVLPDDDGGTSSQEEEVEMLTYEVSGPVIQDIIDFAVAYDAIQQQSAAAATTPGDLTDFRLSRTKTVKVAKGAPLVALRALIAQFSAMPEDKDARRMVEIVKEANATQNEVLTAVCEDTLAQWFGACNTHDDILHLMRQTKPFDDPEEIEAVLADHPHLRAQYELWGGQKADVAEQVVNTH